jgi:antitoxin component YwqK of YwqJK toxin-antitoxin module
MESGVACLIKTSYYEPEEFYAIDNQKHGEYKLYYHEGGIKKIEHYVKDKLHGKSTGFYPNGQIKFVCSYINGRLNGECFYYHENTTIKFKITYYFGAIKGRVISYFPNGQIQYEYKMYNCMIEGEYLEYYQSQGDYIGNLRYKFNYLHGKQIDDNFYYDKEGRLIKIIIYIYNRTTHEISKMSESIWDYSE